MHELITLLAVVLGWILNELATFFRLRREDRRAAGPILMELLDIRHRLLGLDAVISELKRQLPIPAEAEVPLKEAFRRFVPLRPCFQERYDEAVSIVAQANPVLAARLSRQSSLEPILTSLRNVAASDPAASKFWGTIGESSFLQLVKPHLEELIIEVAQAHGLLTRWRVRRTLKNSIELTGEERQQFSSFLSQVRTATPPNAS